jgi:peptidoglycan/LPS O-acetylase OafA/YrhL
VSRYRSLDGLRGVAALVVVVHHCLLTSAVLAATYRGGTTGGWGLNELLARTPLHLVWDGTGAVLVFFVLSGFVLTLAFIQPAPPRWANYYARRLPRLYLPVWAALALAVALAALAPRLVTNGQSWWINAHASPATVSMVAKDATLLTDPSLLDSALWSLRWEVMFSLLLPLYIWFAVKWRGLAWLKFAAALALIGLGSKTGHASLLYLPVFALGVLMASERERILAVTARFSAGVWTALVTVAVLLLTFDWMFGPYAEWVIRPVRSAGAALIVLGFLNAGAVVRFASKKPVQWLGRISFSLYLVHEPIVVTVDRLLPGDNALEVLVIALPIALAIAAIFYKLIEVPALKVSHLFGRLEAKPPTFWSLPADLNSQPALAPPK